MARAAPILSSFNAGEMSPRMAGRVDVGKYANGCKFMENYIPLIQGPAMRRGSTRFVAEVKNSAHRTWLVRFEYNVQQAYILEFGDKYIRFYTNRGQLVTGAVSAWATATGYTVGNLRSNGGVNYYCTTDHTSGVFATDLASGYWYALTGSIYEIPTPWTVSDLTATDNTMNLRFVESNDVIYICHPNYAPRKLSRYGATDWRLSTLQTTGGPFKTINTTTTTVYASAATGTGVTLTASANIFQAGHVGSLFYLEQKSAVDVKVWEAGKAIALNALRRSDGKNYKALNAATTGGVKPLHTKGAVYDGDAGVQWQYQDPGYGYVKITGYTSPTQVTVDVLSQLPDNAVLVANASTRWAFGAWSDIEGWPSQVTFFKERLIFGRGQNIWMSVAGDYENYSKKDDGGVITADMSISILTQSDQVNNIRWMTPYDSLIVGTAGGEFAVQPITTNQVFGPENVTAPQVSAFGSKSIMPVRVSNTVLFVQRSGLKLRDIVYDFLSNKFESKDKTVLSEHVSQSGINQLAFQQEPFSIVWMTLANGKLIGFTFNKEQEVEGWHPHKIGGSAVVEAISTIAAPAADRDDLWMICKRTVNGSTKRYIEYMDYERQKGDDPEDSFYVDCGLTLNNTVAATLTPGAGAMTAHATGVVFAAGSAVFSAGDVGKEIHYRYSYDGVDGDGTPITIFKTAKALITAYTDTTHVVCTINAEFPSLATIASAGWRKTVTSISGLSHLEGATVAVLADGATHPDCVVSGGTITLQRAASKVHVGYACPARMQTMRLNAGAQDGTSQGKTARINKASIRILESLGLKYGQSFDKLDEVDFRTALMDMDNPPDLHTGDVVVDWPGEYDTKPWLCIEQPYPLPSTIVSLMPIVSTYDRG